MSDREGDLDDGADARDLARTLHWTLAGRFAALPGDLTVAPGHYGGRAERAADGTDTARLGAVRERLAAFGTDEGTSVEGLLADPPPRPANHATIVEVNLGRATVDDAEAFEFEFGPNNCAAAPAGD